MRLILFILIFLVSCSPHRKTKFYKTEGYYKPKADYGLLKEKDNK